jgi:HPt (histidine-containing phosphotransfer) domain-containing protein
MYYIVNHTQHIIAADNSLLELLSVESIDELYTKIALGDINFTPSNEKVTITTVNGTESYKTQSHILSGMLGNITLVQIHPSPEAKASVIDDELFDLISDVEETGDKKEEKISFDDEPFDIMSDVEEKAEEKISFDDDKPFDLMSDVEEIRDEAPSLEGIEDDTSPIVVDIESISQDIGISTDDYNNFLNEYIDTALTLEKDLESTEKKKRTHAISTLSHLSNVLHLPVITNIIGQIEDSSSDEQDRLIKSLYATLARLTTTQIETIEETPAIEPDIATESFGTINLDDVKPIHFDFQMEAAANDLSLPVELIEEFVHDFIEQARVETDKMVDAYEKGDLDTIQKIGHLLKGTASNLRINPLADTLYEIQFCEDSDNLEKLIKEYWGHFLSFETQINLTSK